MKKTITSLLFLVTISSSFSYAHSKYFYEKDIQLTGIKKTLSFVDQITEDRTTQIPILKLNKPISVVPTRLDPEEIDVPERNISHIQLAYTGKGNITNGCIVVKGKLFHAHSGYHYTKVLIYVKDFRPCHK